MEKRNKSHDWIGQIPFDWLRIKLKYAVIPINEKVSSESTLKYVGLENIESKTGRYIETEETISVDGISNRFKTGDVLFGKLRPYLSKCIIAEFNGRGTTELLVLRKKEKTSLNRFIKYVMLNEKFIDVINSSTYGAKMPRANWEFIGEQVIPLPPLTIQNLISNYLDQKTSEIDSLIADKEKLIELLQENRRVKIAEFITKGLKPNAKMKDSNVGWIDKIPEHWEEKKIKYLFYEVNERNFEEDAELLSVFTSIGVRPRSQMEDRGNKAQTVMNYKKVKKGDIVVNKLLAWMGAIGISDYEGVTSPDYDVYRQINENLISNKYYHYYFRSHYFKGDCYKFGRGIMMMRWRTYPEQFKSIPVPVPPIEEQIEIANYIDEKTKDIDLLITETKSAISKLREYRQSLIYEAVTGKIDVRDYEKLPS